MSEAQKWLPWAFDHLQPAKKLVAFVYNVLLMLALAQLVGVDIATLTSGNVVPPVPWWGTGGIGMAFMLIETRISNQQEKKLRENVATGSGPG